MPRIRMFTLGTAAAVASADRDNTSILIELDGEPILVDFCGRPCAAMERVGVDWLDVRRAIVTHDHLDHLAGLVSFLHHRLVRTKYGDGTPAPPLEIFCPPPTAARIEAMVEAAGLADAQPLSLQVIEPAGETRVLAEGWRVTWWPAVHGTALVHGLVIESLHADVRVAYSADSEPTDAFLARAAGADVLIHDCQQVEGEPTGHASAESLADAIEQHTLPGLLVPVHVRTHPEDEGAAIARRLRERLAIPVAEPRDGACVFEHEVGVSAAEAAPAAPRSAP